MSHPSNLVGLCLIAVILAGEGLWAHARIRRRRRDPSPAISHDGLRWQLSAEAFERSRRISLGSVVVLGLAPSTWPVFEVASAFILLRWAIAYSRYRYFSFDLTADPEGVSVRRALRPFSLRWAEIEQVHVVGNGLVFEVPGRDVAVQVPAPQRRADLLRVAEWLESARAAASNAPALEPVPADLKRFVALSAARAASPQHRTT
jgi:hypothetical protein